MTKGGEVLKNNYTVSSRKRFLFYILMILSLLCIIALQFFGQNESCLLYTSNVDHSNVQRN